MGDRWARFRKRHWDDQVYGGEGYVGVRTPRLRRIARWFSTHWQRQPIAMLGVAAGIVAAIASLIRALRG